MGNPLLSIGNAYGGRPFGAFAGRMNADTSDTTPSQLESGVVR
jgi:hypothetical protein